MVLIAHCLQYLAVRADKSDAIFLAECGKFRIFRKETIARVYRICAHSQSRADDIFLVQIAFRCGACADTDAFVRQSRRQGISVSLGIDRNGFDAHFAAGAYDAHCHLAPVGNENFRKHSPLLLYQRKRKFRADT